MNIGVRPDAAIRLCPGVTRNRPHSARFEWAGRVSRPLQSDL
ncbi:hypothetical protein SALB1_1754 [Salinisphaera sp. LB1]|nr:hypothetical protein SALB1_1754 [Salinisphaera sp. LB1]